MTYFLTQSDAPRQIISNNPSINLPTFWQGFGAGFSKAALENDANFRLSRETAWVKDNLAADVADRVGLDAVIQHVQESGPGFDHIRTEPTSIEDLFSQYPGEATGWVLDVARQMAEENPTTWADVDLSDDAVSAEVDRRLQAEHAETVQIIDMLPPGQRGVAEFAGGMAGITLDVKNLPFMLMGGGGGSFLRVMGREALINMGAEAAFLPSQYKMAERLDIPDPNVAQQLMMAAGAGAGFGLAGETVARAWRYLTGRKRVPVGSTGRSEVETAAMIDRAEDILSGTSSDPLGEISDMVARADRQRPRTFQEDFANPAPRTGAASYPNLRETPQINADTATATIAGDRMGRAPETPAEMRTAAAVGDVYRRWNETPDTPPEIISQKITDAVTEAEARLKEVQGKGPKAEVRAEIRDMKADLAEIQALPADADVPAMLRPTEPTARMATAEGLGTNVARDPNFQQAGPRNQIDEVLDRQRAPQQEPDQPAPQQGTAPQARGATGAQAAPQAQAIAAPVDAGPTPIIGPVKPEKRPAGYVDQLSSRGAEPFSDPLSPEARVLHDQIEADLRTAMEADPNLKVDMGDGKGERSVAAVLDDLDRAETFADTIALCGRKA